MAMQALLPVMGGLGMVLFMVANGNPVFLLAGVVMVAATLGGAAALLLGQRSGARRSIRMARERYLAHLEDEREELRAAARRQADLAAFLHPDPGALGGLVAEPAGCGSGGPAIPTSSGSASVWAPSGGPSGSPSPAATDPLDPRDPVCRRAAQLLVERYRDLPNQPLLVPVAGAESITVVGAPDDARRVGRLLVAQLAAQHSPEEVRLAICCPRRAGRRWSAAKWLPHCLDAGAATAARHGRSPPTPWRRSAPSWERCWRPPSSRPPVPGGWEDGQRPPATWSCWSTRPTGGSRAPWSRPRPASTCPSSASA